MFLNFWNLRSLNIWDFRLCNWLLLRADWWSYIIRNYFDLRDWVKLNSSWVILSRNILWILNWFLNLNFLFNTILNFLYFLFLSIGSKRLFLFHFWRNEIWFLSWRFSVNMSKWLWIDGSFYSLVMSNLLFSLIIRRCLY